MRRDVERAFGVHILQKVLLTKLFVLMDRNIAATVMQACMVICIMIVDARQGGCTNEIFLLTEKAVGDIVFSLKRV